MVLIELYKKEALLVTHAARSGRFTDCIFEVDKMLASSYQSTRRHIPEDDNLYNRCHHNLESDREWLHISSERRHPFSYIRSVLNLIAYIGHLFCNLKYSITFSLPDM
jgi:hypothetical protein